MNAFPWNIFFILLAAGVLGGAAVLPYALSMNPKAMEMLKKGRTAAPGTDGAPAPRAKRSLPIPVLLLISIVQTGVLIALATFVGLLAGKQVGLGAPILAALVEGRPVMDKILAMLPAAVLSGLAAGAIIMLLEAVYFMQRIPRQLAKNDIVTAFWKRALACFYGGIDEEILLRLFVMSGLVWLLGLLWKAPDGGAALGAFWLANILATLLFGAGHLPATAQITKLTRMVVLRALVLNGIPGLVCGYLYMRYGLEAAILSHFSADIIIHLVATPFMQRRARALPDEPAAQPV